VALSLICPKLGADGRMVALDRSATMIAAAAERNREHVEEKKLALYTAAIGDGVLGEQTFDKIFAVNVNLFWVSDPAEELEAIRTHLAPEGTLHLFWEPPSPDKTPAMANKVGAALERNGFTFTQILTRPAFLTFVARPSG
jgi:SAM-dependent methyltransferase